MPEEMNAYEAERAARIDANKERMRALGLAKGGALRVGGDLLRGEVRGRACCRRARGELARSAAVVMPAPFSRGAPASASQRCADALSIIIY